MFAINPLRAAREVGSTYLARDRFTRVRAWVTGVMSYLFAGTIYAQAMPVDILYIQEVSAEPPAIPAVSKRAEDEGVAGARLGIEDSNTTGRFLKHDYSLHVISDTDPNALFDTALSWKALHSGVVVADVGDALLRKLIHDGSMDVVINVGSATDNWRSSQCETGLLHTLPSHAMLADALAQYLTYRRWGQVLAVSGKGVADEAILNAYKRAAKRFGLKILDTRKWTFTTDLRRAAQQEVAQFTRLKNYDVVLVADAANQFGFYLPYNTYLPRPVVGTHGLTPSAWHVSVEQWGALQLQNRFHEDVGRDMRGKDYAAWVAVRAVSEAVTRTSDNTPKTLYNYMMSDSFELAAFKGRKLTFRQYNGQLRQPIPVAHPHGLVTQSPQDGFLHQVTELDTLGYDKPEVSCDMETTL